MQSNNRHSPDSATLIVRRFSGPEALEISILCRPARVAPDVVSQAESIYRTLHDRLASEGGGLRHVVYETVFFRKIADDLTGFRRVRDRIFAAHVPEGSQPACTLVQQPPLDERETLEVLAFAVIPHDRARPYSRTIWNQPPCKCNGCSRFATHLYRLGAQEHLYAGSITGSTGSAYDQTHSMFDAAERILRQESLTFRDVIRTWIYLRDIDRDYAEFNRARRDFFARAGITLHPASTGIQGTPFPAGHNLSMSLYAIRSPIPLPVDRMSAPTLNEAWMYGSDFSRGLKVVEGNKVALYVSGTASVDEEGRTAHVGDFEAQVDRMLLNISTLVSAQNASLADLASAVTYLKHPGDAPRLREILRRRGLEDLPHALVHAPVCRPDLLCEMEAIAVLPLPRA